MRFFHLLVLATSVSAQAVTSLIEPQASPPAGCYNSRRGAFQITVESASGSAAAPRAIDLPFAAPLQRRQGGNLQISLTGGVLVDSFGRTGYIASNFQFQFDGPPQAGAIYTGGFSICPNGTLALGGSAIFWSCKTGSSFDNLYDRNFAPSECSPVYIASTDGAGSDYSTTPPKITGTAGGMGGGSASVESTPMTVATTPATTPMTTASVASSEAAPSAAPAPSVSPASNAAALGTDPMADSMFAGLLGILFALALA